MKVGKVFFAVVMVFAFAWQAGAMDIRPLIIDKILAKPKAGHEQGWLEISNEDRSDYFLDVREREQRIFLHRGGKHGGVRIPSGTSVYIVVPARRIWTLAGDSRESLVVAAYNQRTTPIRITPLGKGRDVGIRVTVHDGRKDKSAILFGYSRRPEWDAPGPKHPTPAPKPGVGHPSGPQQQPGPGGPARPGSNAGVGGPAHSGPGGAAKPGSGNPGPGKPGNDRNVPPGNQPPRR